MDDWLESEEFYNAMQGYRIAPMDQQREVVAHFENVKRKIREQMHTEVAALKYSLQLDEDLIGKIQQVISVLASRPVVTPNAEITGCR